MAPEFPSKLVVVTLDLHEGVLCGPVEYWENPTDEVLRVRWNTTTCPPGFVEAGEGVVYVENTEHLTADCSTADLTPTSLGNGRYRLREGLRPHELSLMIVLVLPQGYTADNLFPAPFDAKVFQGRLALFWLLDRGETGRKVVEWQLLPFAGSLAREAERINNLAGQRHVPAGANLVVDDLPYDPAAVRDLMAAAFTAEALRQLVQFASHPELRALRRRFGPGDSLMTLIGTTIEYCETHLLLSELLREVERENPRQFKRFASRLGRRLA